MFFKNENLKTIFDIVLGANEKGSKNFNVYKVGSKLPKFFEFHETFEFI